jgi:two-component system LytT family response regulator
MYFSNPLPMLKAVILDDEERGSSLLSRKLESFEDELEIAAVFNDPYKALIKNCRYTTRCVVFGCGDAWP